MQAVPPSRTASLTAAWPASWRTTPSTSIVAPGPSAAPVSRERRVGRRGEAARHAAPSAPHRDPRARTSAAAACDAEIGGREAAKHLHMNILCCRGDQRGTGRTSATSSSEAAPDSSTASAAAASTPAASSTLAAWPPSCVPAASTEARCCSASRRSLWLLPDRTWRSASEGSGAPPPAHHHRGCRRGLAGSDLGLN